MEVVYTNNQFQIIVCVIHINNKKPHLRHLKKQYIAVKIMWLCSLIASVNHKCYDIKKYFVLKGVLMGGTLITRK